MKTVTVKTSDLAYGALDWAVGYAVHGEARPASTGWKFGKDWLIPDCDDYGCLDGPYSPSTDWVQGGPLIEERLVDVKQSGVFEVIAYSEEMLRIGRGEDDSLLVSAMRAIVVAELGDTVDIPEELTK